MKSTGWGALYFRISQINWTRSNRLSWSPKFYLWLLVPAMWHLSLTFSSLTQGSKGEINFLSLANCLLFSFLNLFFLSFFFFCRQDFWLMAHGDGISHKLFPVFKITSQAGASWSTAQPGGVQGKWEPNTGKHQAGIKPVHNWLFILTGIFLLLLFFYKGRALFESPLYSCICLMWVFPDQHTKRVFTCPALRANLVVSCSKQCSCLVANLPSAWREDHGRQSGKVQNHLLQPGHEGLPCLTSFSVLSGVQMPVQKEDIPRLNEFYCSACFSLWCGCACSYCLLKIRSVWCQFSGLKAEDYTSIIKEPVQFREVPGVG